MPNEPTVSLTPIKKLPHSAFKPGFSGNPGGKLKTRHIRLALEKVLLAPEPHGEQGETKLEAMSKRLVRAINEVLESITDPAADYDIEAKATVIETCSKAYERLGLRLEGSVDAPVEATRESKVYLSGGKVTKTEEVLTVKETHKGESNESDT